ncbi:hypothetical protein ACFL5V_12805, partial [Fibrobacterota bacterium]
LFSQRHGLQSVAFNNKIWIIGGREEDAYRNDVWNSEDGVTWTNVLDSASFPNAYYEIADVYKEKIWIIGGGEMIWYSGDGTNWNQGLSTSGFSGRDEHSSVVFDDKLWIIGGSNRNDVWYLK